MRKLFVITISLLVLSACPGCGAKNSDKVLGVWQTAEKKGSLFGFIEIRKDKMIRNGDDSVDIALEDKDGKVSVRLAGTDEVFAVIAVIDDKNIEIAYPGMLGGGKEKLTKSSIEEMNAAFNPPKEKIIGVWRTEQEGVGGIFGFLEITADSLIFDGEQVPVDVSTQKGAYVATVEGGRKWKMILGDDDKLHFPEIMSNGRAFVRSSPAEAAAAASARIAFIEKHYGFWRETEARFNEPYGFLEIGEGYVDENGKRVPADAVMDRNGIKLIHRDTGNDIMAVTLDDSGGLRVSKGYFGGTTYIQGEREELEKINNPKIEHVLGFWVLENPEADSYRTLEIAPNYIVRDKRREETVTPKSRSRFSLAVARREPKEVHCFDVSRISDDHILLSYGDYDKHEVRYRRADKTEYDKAAATTFNPLEIIVGYWRSAEPVEDTRGERVVHATAVFAAGVQGKKAPVVDWSNVSFISSANGMRNRSFGGAGTEREGVWRHPKGHISAPLELYDFDGQGSWVQVRVIDANTLDIAVDGKNFVRCVRSNQEEVVRLRAEIQR